jgi:hypothetical protein
VADEASHTSVLSRQWHYVHTTAPVMHLVDSKRDSRQHVSNLPIYFDHQVNITLLCQKLASIATIRLDVFDLSPDLLNQWIIIALNSCAEEVDVKLRES